MDPSYLIEKFHTVILGWFMKSVVSIHHQTSMLYNYRHCNYSLIATVHDMRVSVGRGTSLKNVLRHENRRVEEQEKHTLRTTKRCSEWCMSSEQLLGNVSAITTTYELPTLLLSEIPRHIKSVCFFSQISEFKSVPRAPLNLPTDVQVRAYIHTCGSISSQMKDGHPPQSLPFTGVTFSSTSQYEYQGRLNQGSVCHVQRIPQRTCRASTTFLPILLLQASSVWELQ